MSRTQGVSGRCTLSEGIHRTDSASALVPSPSTFWPILLAHFSAGNNFRFGSERFLLLSFSEQLSGALPEDSPGYNFFAHSFELYLATYFSYLPLMSHQLYELYHRERLGSPSLNLLITVLRFLRPYGFAC